MGGDGIENFNKVFVFKSHDIFIDRREGDKKTHIHFSNETNKEGKWSVQQTLDDIYFSGR